MVTAGAANEAGALIRPEVPADFDAVATLLIEAFGQPDESLLVEQLRSEGHHVPELTLVAELGGGVVGHILLSRVEVEDGPGGPTTPALALAPVAVLSRHQRKGVGSALVRSALERAEHRPEAAVIVLGHPAYYPRFGFVPAVSLGISAPWPDVPSDAFLVRPLPAYTDGCRGVVRYPPAFHAL